MIMFPQPSEDTLILWIVHSSTLANVPLSGDQVLQTLQYQEINPVAAGHLSTIQMALKLAHLNEFPSRHPYDCSSVAQSQKNLYWLRDLHEQLMKPVARFTQMMPGLEMTELTEADCGKYRLWPKSFTRFMSQHPVQLPDPGKLSALMHWWYQDLSAQHLALAPKLDKANVLIPDLKAASDLAYLKHIQLCCIMPFSEGNGRLARLLENLLRLRWGLAWKTIRAENGPSYAQDIQRYEDSNDWATVKSTT